MVVADTHEISKTEWREFTELPPIQLFLKDMIIN